MLYFQDADTRWSENQEQCIRYDLPAEMLIQEAAAVGLFWDKI